jgi:hypothetical protein
MRKMNLSSMFGPSSTAPIGPCRWSANLSVLTAKLLVGEVTTAEAVALLGLSERPVWRLRQDFERDGPAALVHGNRGRPSPHRLAEGTQARIL